MLILAILEDHWRDQSCHARLQNTMIGEVGFNILKSSETGWKMSLNPMGQAVILR
jgi:hypothetical protein